MFDVERSVRKPLARSSFHLQCHQAFENPKKASVGYWKHARWRDQIYAPFEEWELIWIEQLAAARLDKLAWMPFVDQSEEREQPTPPAAPLVHRVGINCGVLDKSRIQTSRGIARFVDFARSTIKA